MNNRMKWLEVRDQELESYHLLKLHSNFNSSLIKMDINMKMKKKINTVHCRPILSSTSRCTKSNISHHRCSMKMDLQTKSLNKMNDIE